MTASAPLVSVLMPVYNGAKYLRQAMDSVLSQTFGDFEFIVVDDGSTDESADIVRGYADERIRLVQNENNLGLAGARNRALREAGGKYIAWLDADDYSDERRLETQVELLEHHEDVGVCGSWVEIVGGREGEIWRFPVDGEAVKARMLFEDPIATSSVLMRRSLIEENALAFDLSQPPAEDYDLWEKLSRITKLVNIAETLTTYRIHGAQTSAKKAQAQLDAVWRVQERQLLALGLVPTEGEKTVHLNTGVRWLFSGDIAYVKAVERWLSKIARANRERQMYPEPWFSEELARRWRQVCEANTDIGLGCWWVFIGSSIKRWVSMSAMSHAKFLAKCLIKHRREGLRI